MLLKTVKFFDKDVKINISGLIGIKYRAEFGKDIFTFMNSCKTLIPKKKNEDNFEIEKLDFKLLEDATEIAYLMIKYGGNTVGSFEDFVSNYDYMSLGLNSLNVVYNFIESTNKIQNTPIGYKKSKKKKQGR